MLKRIRAALVAGALAAGTAEENPMRESCPLCRHIHEGTDGYCDAFVQNPEPRHPYDGYPCDCDFGEDRG